MVSAKKPLVRAAAALLCSVLSLKAFSLEFGVDASFSGSALLDDWGASAHGQIVSTSGYGLDVGYQYQNSISYEALGTQLSHVMSQYEISGLWQLGDKAFRLQLLSGLVISDSWVESQGQEVIAANGPGYQLGVSASVPVFSRVRAFAEAGYQGWLGAEIPNHLNWRYGVRILFGGAGGYSLEQSEKDKEESAAETLENAKTNPTVSIDPAVPKYMPSHLSESLPPIIAQGEICKCFPAGPYTLQLGEFTNMAQAVRALEFRGLRQFFNSRSYYKSPEPVFLAQGKSRNRVSIYFGELNSIDELQYWRHELRKNGLQAQFRKIVGSNGERVENSVIAMDEKLVRNQPKYSAEEIRRMNSLPESEAPEKAMTDKKSIQALLSERDSFETELQENRRRLNQLSEADQAKLLDSVVQIGPLPHQQLLTLLEDSGFRDVLSHDAIVQQPAQMTLVWDEKLEEAWLSFTGFAGESHLDEWQAWLNSGSLVAQRVEQAFFPVGDVYHFALGQPIEPFSVEIERQTAAGAMLSAMRSPEILWFQAYQRINDQPVQTSLNWSKTDNRYHLIVTNILNAEEQQNIWANLTAVGLLPSLAEQ